MATREVHLGSQKRDGWPNDSHPPHEAPDEKEARPARYSENQRAIRPEPYRSLIFHMSRCGRKNGKYAVKDSSNQK